MARRVTVPKIGIGEELPAGKELYECASNEGPYRPDTSAQAWQKITETVNSFEILILEE
ncbi:hypothetical protein [Paenibacillus sp. P22]|uniref:hypothetical protein n=1 Tax=Paenibacillus sp. P22 TaxID=483908 RepID=UPI00038F47C1|nr:hypothetical protein [Paenibacillus sp. P22]CDN41948.1 hypothetical protein BN871_AQ_00190 [Paenibacillus sp. P22]